MAVDMAIERLDELTRAFLNKVSQDRMATKLMELPEPLFAHTKRRRRTPDEIALDDAVKFLATPAYGPFSLSNAGRGVRRKCRDLTPPYADVS